MLNITFNIMKGSINMLKKDNNLFKFATKETTQDSFFSWIINFYNVTDDELYKNFSKEFLKAIMPKDLVDKVNDIKSIDITRQFCDIDILLTLNMKNNEQYYLIIENKTSSDLGPHQTKTILYYTKLIHYLYNNKDKFKELSIDVDTVNRKYEDKVYAVLIKTTIRNNDSDDKDMIINSITTLNKEENEYDYYQTSKQYIESLSINQFLDKHIKFINTDEDLLKITNVISKYKSLDNLIESYYDSMLKNDENNVDSIVKRGYLVENKTHFRTNKLCFKCFNNDLTTRDLDNINNQSNSITLDKLNYEFNDDERKLVIVDTLNFKSGNYYDNKFEYNDDFWFEKIRENNNSNKIRYIFLFIKEIDFFRNEYYTFKGLYRFKEISNVNEESYNIWEKCKVSDNGTVSIKKKDIETYIEKEEIFHTKW